MRDARREYVLFFVLAIVAMSLLFRDALVHGYVLGQSELLLAHAPWRDYAPQGWRPGNYLLTDSPTVFYPFLVHARESVRAGQFPLWASAMASGQPFFAAFQTAVLSPFMPLGYILPLPDALTAIAAARLIVGALGMLVFLRSLPLSFPAALFGAVAYLLNPFSIVWLEHPLSAAAAWLPWLLFAVDRAATRPTAVSVGGVAIATALALLSGHPETTFKVMLLAGPYGIYRAVAAGHAWRGVPAVVAGVALGTALCAVQLLPFLEYAAESRVLAARSTAAGPLFTSPPAAFVTAFVPDFFGTPLGRRYVLTGANYCEQQIYPGVAVWILAVAALSVPRQRGRTFFFLAAAALATLVMYGTLAARIAVVVMPPLRVAALARFGLLTIAGLIVAASIAVHRLLGDGEPLIRRERIVMGAAATCAGLTIAGIVFAFLASQRPLLEDTRQLARTLESVRTAMLLIAAAVAAVWIVPLLRRSAAAALLIALIGMDLFAFADGFHPLRPRSTTFPDLPEVAAIRADPGLFRVAGWNMTLPPNTARVYGLHDFRGYDGIGVQRYAELLDSAFAYDGSTHLVTQFGASNLLDLLNVKYVLVPDDVAVPADRFTLVKDGRTRVYRNDRALPRAFLVGEVRVLDGNEARRAIRDGSVDLGRTVVVETPLPAGEQPEPAGEAAGAATVRRYEDQRVEIQTSAAGTRLLVLSDTFYPGWTASVDGIPAPIHRANYAFRAVAVPAGHHTIEFRYEPRSVRYGLWCSVAAMAVLALLFTWGALSRSA